MARFVAGVVSALLFVAAGLFFWQGRAQQQSALPPPPQARLSEARVPLTVVTSTPSVRAMPPAATQKTREEKRFGRADKDDDGRITREEMLSPRRKAFAKLDKNSDGRLAFEEWAVKTMTKFADADDDGSGVLTAAEYESTKAKVRPKAACRC